MRTKFSDFICLSLCVASFAACWPRHNKSQDSELDAITAASRRLFGQNVRGYMWALTTDSPAIFAQVPTGLEPDLRSGSETFDPFDTQQGDAQRSPAQRAVAPSRAAPPYSKTSTNDETVHGNPYSTEFFQCWYYAEIDVYERLEGEALRKLFLDKSKTHRVNNDFIDVKHLYKEIERTEVLKHLQAFALAALPGTCFLLNRVGPLKAKVKGVIASAFCSVSLAGLATSLKANGDGWSSERAKQHIKNQLKVTQNELDEVNWDVLKQLKMTVGEFNSPEKRGGAAAIQCPANEPWVASFMDYPKK